jgi:carbon monoxide dehydrogenase subunit G
MRMTGEQRIATARSAVWEALNDPDVLRQCIPGCQSLEREAADRLRAVVEIKIGPIGARFNAVVTLADVNAPHSYTLNAEGQGGTVGSAKSSIGMRLADDGGGTLLSYEVDAQVSGRLAQLGGPLIDATAKQLAGKFFKRFGEIVGAAPEGAQAAPAKEAPTHVASGASLAAAPLPTTAQSSAAGFPIAWILALVVAALVGFLIGRGQSGVGGSDWMGLAIGLLIVIVAAAGFEFGRRTAAPYVVLDAALLQRLLRGDKQ